MSWQPIETAPPNERILVFHPHYPRRALLGIHYTVPYRMYGNTGWRISIHPSDRWEWLRVPPTLWHPLPELPAGIAER